MSTYAKASKSSIISDKILSIKSRKSRDAQRSGIPDDYRNFDHLIDSAARSRFADFRARAGPAFAEHLKLERNRHSGYHFQLKVLRKGCDQVELYIFMFCEKEKVKAAQQWFESNIERPLLCPNDPSQKAFKIEVRAGTLRPLSTDSIEVVGASSAATSNADSNTSCGTLIKMKLEGRTSYATMGVLIMVLTTDGRYSAFAITARHFLDHTFAKVARNSTRSSPSNSSFPSNEHYDRTEEDASEPNDIYSSNTSPPVIEIVNNATVADGKSWLKWEMSQRHLVRPQPTITTGR